MYAVAVAVGLSTMTVFASAPPSDYDVAVDDLAKEFSVGRDEGGSWLGSGPGSEPSTKPPVRYFRSDESRCNITDLDRPDPALLDAACGTDDAIQPLIVIPACPPDGTILNPLWAQHLQPDGTYGPPEQVSGYQCVLPADLAAEAARQFALLPVPTPAATLQTGDPHQLLVNAWYPVYTNATTLTQQATLLQVPVEIRATPDQFTWDFDDPFSPDGGTLTTTDLGAPWQPGMDEPDHHWLAHAWTRLGDPDTPTGQAAGSHWTDDTIKYRTDVTITLTTTWHGQFRIAGSPTWTTIPGQLTTTSTAGTYTVTEARTRLVCDDLTGNSTC